MRRIRIPSRIQSICVTSIHHSSLEWPSRALCLGFPGAGSSVEAASPTALQQVIGCQLRCTRFPTRVVLQPTGESLVYGCLNRTDGHFRAYGQTLRYQHGDRRPTASVYQPRLRLERPRVPSVARAESRPGSRLRPGEQLVISAATLENRACSPGRPFCPVQGSQQFESTPAVRADGGTARQGEQLVISAETLENRASSPSRPFRPAQALWKQALEEELGAVFGSRVPVRKAAERPSQGLSRELAGAVSGLNQASSSVKSGEPRRKSRTVY